VGSNEADVTKINDDDESSSWSSEDALSTAWVQLEFDRPTQVSAVLMRLGSWRTTSYPLRILADDKEVFDGIAPATIGYTTLPLPATACRTIRIQLAGAPRGGGNAQLIEVTGKADAHGGDAGPNARGKLVIHELELLRSTAPVTASAG
jgi:hypothetical protein